LTALRPALSARRSSEAAGGRLLDIYSRICSGEFDPAKMELPRRNAPVAYGVVFFERRLQVYDARKAKGCKRVSGIISAGLRLISIGQQQGQQLLSVTLARLPGAAGHILKNIDEPLRAFSPLMDIAQMNHQYLYSRLFRS
jgi:urease accessory protein